MKQTSKNQKHTNNFEKSGQPNKLIAFTNEKPPRFPQGLFFKRHIKKTCKVFYLS